MRQVLTQTNNLMDLPPQAPTTRLIQKDLHLPKLPRNFIQQAFHSAKTTPTATNPSTKQKSSAKAVAAAASSAVAVQKHHPTSNNNKKRRRRQHQTLEKMAKQINKEFKELEFDLARQRNDMIKLSNQTINQPRTLYHQALKANKANPNNKPLIQTGFMMRNPQLYNRQKRTPMRFKQ